MGYVAPRQTLNGKMKKELVDQLTTYIAHNGMSIKDACALCGIHQASYYHWRAFGESVENAINEGRVSRSRLTRREQMGLYFLEQLRPAHARAVQRNVAIVLVAAQNDWKAAAWWLQHASDQYGPKVPREVAEKAFENFRNEYVRRVVDVLYATVPDKAEQIIKMIESGAGALKEIEAQEVDEVSSTVLTLAGDSNE